MHNRLAHYVERGWKLGAWGSARRVWAKVATGLDLRWQALWWGWLAGRTMSDAALLARMIHPWDSTESLLSHFASRAGPSFLLPHESAHETEDYLKRHYPAHLAAIIATADAACRNELCLQGEVFVSPEGIDWHREPVSGFRYPLWHRSRFIEELLGAVRPADIRKYWELNRHQHFVCLGMAYWLTGEPRYVDAFNSHLDSWIEANPLQHGANWCLGIEISLRIVAWTVAFQFFRHSPEFMKNSGSRFLKSLWQQADFLSKHLQTTRTDVPNNHMIAEVAGLALVASAFPEFDAASLWCRIGLSSLAEQLPDQTHADGVNREQAMGYHRFVAELLLLVLARSRQGALPPLSVVETTLEGMLDYVLFTLSPIGTGPMWGDSASGRALCLGKNEDFWDLRPLLSAGAVLFRRSDWKYAALRFDEEAFWLLGVEGAESWRLLEAQRPTQTSRAFEDAGVYVIRDSWAADTDMVLFRCGSFGLGGKGHCAHAHCDLLSPILWINGEPILVDLGTYLYHPPLREFFRLTSAHNTVVIDGKEQATPMPHFNWAETPTARCVSWTGMRVCGAMRSGGVEFVRELDHPRRGVWELADHFDGTGTHYIEWCFNFAPDLDLQLVDAGLTMRVIKAGAHLLDMSLPRGLRHPVIEETWYSPHYGVKQRTKRLTADWHGDLDKGGTLFRWKFETVTAHLRAASV